MGSSASQGGPQQMPQPGMGGPQKMPSPGGPVMDYNNAGRWNNVMYGQGAQQMPQNPGSSPVMDYNNAGPGQRVQYGQGSQVLNPGMPVQNPGMLNPGGYRMPGFTPGGPDDPANGGSGYMNGGGLLNGDYRKGLAPPNMRPGLLKPGQAWGDMGGNRTFEFRDSDGNGVEDRDQPGYRPPVQNPGMPNNKAPGTLIDGGAKGEVYNPKPKPKPKGAFKGLSKGTMPSMKKHVQSGKMGQAKKAFEAGGGKWSKDVHKRLKKKYG